MLRKSTLGLLLALVAFVRPCSAEVVIDFNIDAVQLGSPSYSFAGGVAPLLGSGINVDTVVGLDTPANDQLIRDLFDSLGVVLHDAQLNFTTGSYLSSTPNSWIFDGGGSLSIVGSVDLDGNSVINAGDIQNAVLATAVFDSPVTVLQLGSNFRLIGASLFSYVNPNLLAFYGLSGSNGPFDASLNLLFKAPSGALPGSAFTSTAVLSGDVAVTVPEASPVLLCGAIILGFAGTSIVRRTAKQMLKA